LKDTKILSLGFVTSNKPSDLALQEILDQQGIIYEMITPKADTSRIYPIVLMSEYTDSNSQLVKERCAIDENVLIASKIIDLQKIHQCLSGLVQAKEDQLELFVNKQSEVLIQNIRDGLAKLNLPLVRKWYWPRGAKACCVLTHDIDWLEYSPFHKTVLSRQLGIINAAKLILGAIFRKNYGCNIPEMIGLEKKFGNKSTFFFRTEYSERELNLVNICVRLLKENNFELGLHASHSSHKLASALKSEIAEFQRLFDNSPDGLRYHILRFDVPSSWQIEDDEGIQYDATFGYNEFFGFRSEVCFPYHPLSVQNHFNVIELPTSFMDWTLLHRHKRGSSAESELLRVKESVEKYNGVLVVNFHNTYLNRNTFPDILDLYASLLKQVSRENYWIPTASECIRWWNERASAMPNPRMGSFGEVVVSTTPVQIVASGNKEFLIRNE